MKTLEIKQENVIKAYNDAEKSVKTLFENLFGKEIFQKSNILITDRVKTYEDACDVLGLDSKKELSHVTEKDEIAYLKLKIIVRALNEGWTPDWNNSNEYKYYPYFRVGSGFGFSYSDSATTYPATASGARLVFKTVTLTEYAGKQFIDIYKDFIL